MKSQALTIRNLSVAYHDFLALFNVHATVPQGSLVAIAGPNGAGKSTLLKAIVGLIKPIAGTINCLGMQYHEYRHLLAYIPQRISVDWNFPLHVLDIVLMGCYKRVGLMRRPQPHNVQQAHAALHQVGMAAYAHTPIAHLSGGQQQRVFIARALVQNASLLFLDEPLIGIDLPTEQTIMAILKQLCREGKTIFIVHHDTTTLQKYFDWVILLNRTIIACGPVETTLVTDELMRTYQHTEVAHE